ncbi:MAG: pyridoxal 5'-phosphate synthase lyase subunit PdxS, partial [Desulfurococcaceae archaeon]
MKLIDAYMYLERLKDLIYSLLEYRDRAKEEGFETIPIREATPIVRYGFISMFKNGVIMDVTSEKQAEIAENAGAVGVMVLDKLPY